MTEMQTQELQETPPAPPQRAADPPNLNDLVQKFIKIRDKMATLKKEAEAELARYKAVQDKIETMMLAEFNRMGVESVRTDAGTAYVSTRTAATLADWDTYKDFIGQQDDPYFFIEKRVSKAAIEAYKTENEGDLPPGVNWSETRTVNFRR